MTTEQAGGLTHHEIFFVHVAPYRYLLRTKTRALHAGTGRASRSVGAGRYRLSPEFELNPRRFAWRRRVFYAVRLFHHRSIALAMAEDKAAQSKQFWIRRARRLMPAMFAMLAVVGLWLLLVDRSRLPALQGDFVSVALYVNNWWLIFTKFLISKALARLRLSAICGRWRLRSSFIFFGRWRFSQRSDGCRGACRLMATKK